MNIIERSLWFGTVVALSVGIVLTNRRIDGIMKVVSAQTDTMKVIGTTIVQIRDFAVQVEKTMSAYEKVHEKQMDSTLKLGEIQGKIVEWVGNQNEIEATRR